MKNTLLLIACLSAFALVFSGCSSSKEAKAEQPAVEMAPEPGSQEMLAEQRNEFIQRLQLTEEQREPFFSVIREYSQKMREVRDSGRTRLEKFQEARALNQQRDEEIRQILTEEQYATYREILKERQEAMRQQRQRSGQN